MELHWVTTLTFLVAFIEIALAVIIFAGTKSYSARTFVVLLILYATWSVTLGTLHGIIVDIEVAEQIFKLTFYEGLLITLVFFYFTLTYPDSGRPPYWVLTTLGVFFISQFSIYFGDGLISGGITPDLEHFGWKWSYGSLSSVFLIPFSLFWTTGLVHLFIKSRKHESAKIRKHLLFMFWAVFIALIPTSIFTLTLPTVFNIYQYNILSPIAGILLTGVISYSIIKYNQMNVKTVAAELLVLTATFLLFLTIFI